MFIESRRARGQSTYMLAKYLHEVEIHSIEMRQAAAISEWRMPRAP